MELIAYIRLVRKWLWLLLVCGFVGGGISFILSSAQPPRYTAKTTLSIGRYIEAQNPDSADIRTGIDLAQTYAQLIRTRDVLQGTVDALELRLSAEQVANLFTTQILTGTSLMVVNVTYTDAVLAADIANAVADQLVLKSPTNLTPDQQAQVDFANDQIAALSEQIAQQRASLANVNRELDLTTSEAERAQLTEQQAGLVDQINQASATVATFQNTVSAIQQRTNALDIVERAIIPTSPIGTNIVVNTLLGALVTMLIAFGIIILIEYLDDRIRSTETAAQVLSLPVIGAIPRFTKRNAAYPDRLITQESSMSPITESYRRLRTNLMFTAESAGGRKSAFVITSSGPEEGKSVTTANLAVTMALAGMNVLLIDADLRRPRVHEIFGLENEVGLTTLLFADPGNGSNGHDDSHNSSISKLNQCLQLTSVPKLKVITSGFTPSNPTEILGSALMKRWIDTFRAARDIDIVLIDTPPALLFADSSILASVAKADVLMVIDAGKTRTGAALETKEQFTQLGLEIKGVIVNRVNPRDERGRYGYSYGYGYGYGYYGWSPGSNTNSGTTGNGDKRRSLFGLRR